MPKRVPELLAPAGGAKQLEAAVRFGADAVYLGLDRNSLRARGENFTREALAEAVAYAHAHKVRVYVTLNIFAFDEDLPAMAEDAKSAWEAGADAAIVADLGALRLMRERVPELELHVSTQANVTNARAARAYFEAGAKRIVLARELSLRQIRGIREKIPDALELEAFVHGAVCMAYSGRCMLSRAATGRSANRGDCAQPCRWNYAVSEEKRPGEYEPVEPFERGTAIFGARDLNMLAHLPELCEAGLSALKIEGRMKNEYAVATVTGAYRRALDAIAETGALDASLEGELQQELQTVGHRESDTGFYFGAPERSGGCAGTIQTREYKGRVLCVQGGRALVETKNRLIAGETLEMLRPDGVTSFTLRNIVTREGEAVESFARMPEPVEIDAPEGCAPGDLLRGEPRNHR